VAERLKAPHSKCGLRVTVAGVRIPPSPLIRGNPPKFFDGHADAFMGLYFNLDEQAFEFYSPTKMKDNPTWISVTELMQMGAGSAVQKLVQNPTFAANLNTYINRLNAIDSIQQIDLHIEEVTGEDKTVDVVVDIFNRVNSGGTKLSKGDLALAKICAEWPDAREEMKSRLEKWRKAGFHFRLEWLLRNINAILTGEALFTALKDVDTPRFKEGLSQSETAIDKVLNLIASRLGLDHDRVLGSRGSIPLMTRYLVQRGGKLPDAHERDQLLFWYVHTILWGRYSGTSETVLNRDLEAIESAAPDGPHEAMDRLIENLRQERGELSLSETDFRGSTKGSRFYPLLYLMTRVCQARDWGTGDELSAHLLGNLNRLQVHHIFPRALLYKAGYQRREVNAIANFTFLTQDTNLQVSNRNPTEYIPAYESKFPGVIATHWIPTDPELWKPENYLDFLSERRKLLALAANDFLFKLRDGAAPQPPAEISVVDRVALEAPGGIEDEREERTLLKCNRWVVQQGLPEGELRYELVDEKTRELAAILDLAWPNGLQEGLSQPVAVLLDEGAEVEEIANAAGFRFFTSVTDFRRYVRREVLAQGNGESDSDVSSIEKGDGYLQDVLAELGLKSVLAKHGLTAHLPKRGRSTNRRLRVSAPSWTIAHSGPDVDGVSARFITGPGRDIQVQVRLIPYIRGLSRDKDKIVALQPQLLLKGKLITDIRDAADSIGDLEIDRQYLREASAPDSVVAVKIPGLPKGAPPSEFADHLGKAFDHLAPIVNRVVNAHRAE
jgi:hypothetical protein